MLRPSKRSILAAFLLATAWLGLEVQVARCQSAATVAPYASGRTARAADRQHPFTIRQDVDLVVLRATVLDHRGRTVDDLGRNDFRVYEDGIPQTLTVFSHADIPVTMGIVIDDSGSMREKRPAVNAAAFTFVKTSNRSDQVFVVNFNDVSYLDTPGDFANNLEDLKAALGHIDSRGGTALYDAVYYSLDHLRLGNRDKKALLVITDGEDNSSRYTFDELVRHAQQSNAAIYSIGLLGDESTNGLFKIHGGEARRAAKILKQIVEVTGGQAYFPRTLDEVQTVCQGIAHDIRNQYTLAYYPTNKRRDGSFRTVRVEAFAQGNHKKLIVRTRPGYYAPKPESASSAIGGK